MSTAVEPWRLHAQTADVRHSYRSASVGVRVSSDARQSMKALAASRDAEVGGMLIGPTPGAADLIEILSASGPGNNAICERDPGRYVPDLEFDLELADRVREQSGGASGVVGEWHSHMVVGSVEPSAPDLFAFRQSRLGFQLERWVAVIVSPTAEGSHEMTAYVVVGEHGDRDVVQRAR